MRLALAALCCLWLCMASCASCDQQRFVAELIERDKTVQRDDAKTQNAWRDAPAGERFVMGDGLRTGKDGQATLKLPQEGRLLVKSDTIVRFQQSVDATAPAPEFDVQQGELTIESGAQPVGVRTARGMVTVEQDTRVRVRAAQDTTRFDVEVGRVEYMVNGTKQVAEAGGSFDLDVLQVSVEEQAAPVPVAVAPETKNSVRIESGPLVFQDAPTSALFQLPAGESATVHDPAPPTDISLQFAGCPEAIMLELDAGESRGVRFRGEQLVRASVARGNHRYRVRCLQGDRPGPVVRSGQLNVITDVATRPLPQTPVTITADADGRRYTVSYQNLLPIITLRWPYAPRASSYHLVVQPAQGQTFSSDSAAASITLPPGRLGEGLHKFWFETADKKRSELGSIQVSFDYTARTAYLSSPRDGEALQGDSVRFAGGTLLGSQVQVQGAAMKLDAHGRFSTQVSVGPEQSGAVVRVQHPSTGIHYYVRHLAR